MPEIPQRADQELGALCARAGTGQPTEQMAAFLFSLDHSLRVRPRTHPAAPVAKDPLSAPPIAASNPVVDRQPTAGDITSGPARARLPPATIAAPARTSQSFRSAAGSSFQQQRPLSQETSRVPLPKSTTQSG